VRHEEHVALVDRLEAADAGAVKPQSFRKAALVQLPEREAEVLPGAGQVDETNIDDLDAFCLRPLQHLARAGLASGLGHNCHEHTLLDALGSGFDGSRVIVGTGAPRFTVSSARNVLVYYVRITRTGAVWPRHRLPSTRRHLVGDHLAQICAHVQTS